MIVKTKKYGLDPKVYRKIGMKNILKEQWWLPLAIFVGVIALNLILNIWYRNYWIFPLAIVGAGGWWVFWWVQFTGIPQLPQFKQMFDKFMYEITSQQIFMKRPTPETTNKKGAVEGMVIKWENIKKVEKNKDGFIMTISKAQFLFFPFKIFNSENDIRFIEVILQRKNLLPMPQNNTVVAQTPEKIVKTGNKVK
jgi:hypothetical protein